MGAIPFSASTRGPTPMSMEEIDILSVQEVSQEGDETGKGGIVRDEATRLAAVAKIRNFALGLGKDWRGEVDSPITGTDGNHEYLAWIVSP